MSKGATLAADWKLLIAVGPCAVFHAACIIKNKFYVHGGLINVDNKQPINNLYWLDLKTGIWNESQAQGSPSLSHHCSVALEDRYMLLIGGWDGKYRTSHLHCYDTKTFQWIQLENSGYPKDSGLSSHTAILCQDGGILVIGREGSLHSHRKHSSAHMLTGDMTHRKWEYKVLSKEIDSRSGHTCSGSGNTIYLIGGRDDQLVEELGGITAQPQLSAHLVRKLDAICKNVTPMNKPPSGRKNHIAVGSNGFIFIHGGETFDGKNNQPIGEIYIVATKKNIEIFKIGTTSIARAGHVCCCYGDRVLMHGGICGKENFVKGDTYELELFSF